jgi:hypothetical protein
MLIPLLPCSDFCERLAVMLAIETRAAADDPERLGEMIERLIHGAAVAIAVTARGDAEGRSALIAAGVAHLEATAASCEVVEKICG